MKNFEVQIWGGDDELHTVSMFNLLQWKHALRLEINKGMKMSRGSVLKHVREVLCAPKSRINDADLLKHIETSIKSINDQLGVETVS